MTYVAAAYAIVGVTLATYGLYLVRERRQLRRNLAADAGKRPEGAPAP